jgi:hypothetical protein
MSLPDTITPYPDTPDLFTSGWSGTDTSHERALRDDASGKTMHRQQEVLRLLDHAQRDGVTVLDIRTQTTMHHGSASAALSNLHQAGKIARLTERRDRCSIYVLPQWVQGRETSPFRVRPVKPKPVPPKPRVAMTDDEREAVDALLTNMRRAGTGSTNPLVYIRRQTGDTLAALIDRLTEA